MLLPEELPLLPHREPRVQGMRKVCMGTGLPLEDRSQLFPEGQVSTGMVLTRNPPSKLSWGGLFSPLIPP
jgi:hypothetical protein